MAHQQSNAPNDPHSQKVPEGYTSYDKRPLQDRQEAPGSYPNGRNTDSSGTGRWQEGSNGHQMFSSPPDDDQQDAPQSSRH